MCGIAGWLDFNDDLRKKTSITDKMSDALTRRGPDDFGAYISENVALIHRRLSVIDPENGKQPMYKSDFIIVYNGELYNTNELKKELVSLGHRFTTKSDTEVLLTSYIEWGKDCLKKLNGIFAFAIYNKKTKSVFCARDRAGVKPFFYHKYNGGFVFGSEIKVLLKNPHVSTKVDKLGLSDIILIGPGRTPGKTPYKDIEELKPGEYLMFSENEFKKELYWKIEAKEHKESLSDTLEHIRFLLCDSIKNQLVSDVPLCCFLSGGLDSSIISSVSASEYKKLSKTLTTYSVDYIDNEKYFKPSYFQPNSDDYFINIMTNDILSEHKKVILDNENVGDALYEATLARDLPGMADVDSSLLLFCREVKKTHTVVLSGECADEIFGGYPWYSNPKVLFADDFPWSGNTEIKSTLLCDNISLKDCKEYVYERYLSTIKSAPKTGYESELDSRIKEVTMLNLKWFMQTLLDRKDRMSMFSGLEVRVPFCDHRIMEYAYNIPWDIKAYKGREKGMLRKAFEGILPDEITKRKKSPYPKSHNPIYVNNVENKIKTLINSSSEPIWSVLNREKIKDFHETKGKIFTRPWYGQLMNYPQILAYFYMINVWLNNYSVDII